MGGAAGANVVFTCPNSACQGAKPICDVDAGMCRGCGAAKAAACGSLDAGTSICVPGDAGPLAGMCVGCLTDNDCGTTPQAPICNLTTGTCQGCDVAGTNACATKDAIKPVCATTATATATLAKGTCVGCLIDGDCRGTGSSKTPICNLSSNTCVPCTADADCKSVGPGVCMTDGHCAVSTEVFFVDESATTCPGTGASATPFCSLPTGAGALAKGQNVLVILGAVGERLVLATSQVSPVIIGRQNAAGDPAVIPASNGAGISVSSDTVLIRDIAVSQGSQSSNTRGVLVTGSASASLLRVTVNLGNGIGVDAETGATLSMDRCYVENNSLGGILVNGALATIQNTIIADNGGTTGYGIQFNAPGANTQFTFNTVADNPTAAISDLGHQVPLNNSIVAGPTTNCPPTNSLTGAMVPVFGSTDLKSTNPYHLVAHAPCPMTPTPPIPAYDIDGQPRVAPVDCGADQFVMP
jgi:hypothetical protein